MNKRIINQLVLNGNTTISEKIWLKSLKSFYKSFIKNNKKCINQALINITPLLKVKQLRQKRKRSQLKEFPYIVSKKTRISLALKFFLNKKKKKMKWKYTKNLYLIYYQLLINQVQIKEKVYMSMLIWKKNTFFIDDFKYIALYV